MTSRLRTALSVARLLPVFLALGALKRLVPLQTLARWSWRPSRPWRGADAARITTLVLRTGSVAGVPDRDCLQRSLLLYRELSRSGLNPELVVGFRTVRERVQGHAWVRVGGVTMAEPSAAVEMFVPALRFGARGAAIT